MPPPSRGITAASFFRPQAEQRSWLASAVLSAVWSAPVPPQRTGGASLPRPVPIPLERRRKFTPSGDGRGGDGAREKGREGSESR